ncbi:hypothetical protein Hamer_G026472, partial [Homarus americanus]
LFQVKMVLANRGQLRSESNKPQLTNLVTVAAAAVLRLLTAAARRRTWKKDKMQLIIIVQTHIPSHLRQRLQERVLYDWRLYDTVSLRLLELVFSSTTSSLRLHHVRAFFRDDLTRLLVRLSGLQELMIQDPTWSLSTHQLTLVADALTKMTCLRVLTLQYCTHNKLLAALADTCTSLQW